MEDYFVLHVDKLIRKSTAETAHVRKILAEKLEDYNSNGGSVTELAECRICHEEDDEFNMEIPCACCGTMKFAHRKCIQRWCDEKEDITCEICRQQFMPGYTACPKQFVNGRMPINLITSTQFDRDHAPSEHDEYSISLRRSVVYCRSLAITFMVLMFLREALPFIFNGTEQYSFPIFMMQLLKTAGIVLPLYIMLRAGTAFQCRHQLLQQQERAERSANLGRA